jgi:hypothetical protein
MRQITEEQMALIRAGVVNALTRKLKAKHVQEIRRLFVEIAPGKFRGRYGLTMEKVAESYGVKKSTVSQIVRRETWKHV